MGIRWVRWRRMRQTGHRVKMRPEIETQRRRVERKYDAADRESWWAGCARQSGGEQGEGNSPENRTKEKPEG